MRICVVYDCLYPWTVGGAERWMRTVAERMAARGHEVTYVTRLQWDAGDAPRLPGVEVVAVSKREPLYGPDGNRTIGEPLRFGRGVLGYLLRHRRDFDVVHTCSFPYFSLLAARVALAGTGTRIGVDWFEVWSRSYWRRYVGEVAGHLGWLVQKACALATPLAFVFSDVHGRRLRAEGLRSEPVKLAGLYGGALEARPGPAERAPLVVFAGRHIPEKRAPLVPAAVAAARAAVPGLRGLVLGDGPERDKVLEAIAAAGVADAVDAPGFVSAEEVDDAFGRASCMLLPSSREGYGMVVIEAASRGTPTVVVAGEDNAAVELVVDGVNGYVARSESPADVAEAIARVHADGAALRERTAAWFGQHAARLDIESSVATLLERYGA